MDKFTVDKHFSHNSQIYNSAEIVHWMKNKNTHSILPAHADIDLTNICNQNCYYCNSADFRSKVPAQRKYTDYIKLLDQLADWRAHTPKSFGTLHSLSYPGGGEPTMLPNYEKVLEHTIDSGFLCSLTTNGSKLHSLIENVKPEKICNIAWIGIDIDAGNSATYETIRNSLTKNSQFDKVIKNATELVKIGAKLDFKVLLCEKNSSKQELDSIFETTKKVNARMVYFRPVILDQKVFNITQEIIDDIEEISNKYSVKYKINITKTLERTYCKCHQMFQFPVFCADGLVYLCCENRGNSNFCLGSWAEKDIRDLWLNERHFEIYNTINTKKCQPCRPNFSNIQIQKVIDNPDLLEKLYV